MKLFLKNITKWLLKVVILIFLLLFLLQDNYWNNRLPILKKKILEKHTTQKNEVSLVLGSSHAFLGIHSAYFDCDAVNLASISQSAEEDFFILKKIYKKNTQINRIYYSYSYITNHHYLQNTPIQGNKTRIYDYEFAYNYSYKKDINYFINKIHLFTEIGGQLFNIRNTHTLDSLGNLHNECDSDTILRNIQEVWPRHCMKQNFMIFNHYVDSICSFCVKNKIEIFFILLPQTNSYYNLVKKTPFDSFLERLKKRYKNPNITFIDHRKFFSADKEAIMFYDEDHLSACGRRIYGSYLKTILPGKH
jgi:hypothetical protein